VQGAITERLEPLVSTGDGGPEPVTSWQRIQDLIVVRSEGARILRFALTGGASTLIYAVATLGLAAGGLAASTASVIAYFAGAAFSYAGHRVFTFVSRGSI